MLSVIELNKKKARQLGIVLFLNFFLIVSMSPNIHGYHFTPLDIQRIEYDGWEYKICVNNETFYVRYTTYNYTWHNKNNNTFSFIAGWAEELEIIPVLREDFNLTAWQEKSIIEEGEYYPYSHDYVLGKDSHTFLARYNGSFFEELLIYGHSSLIADNIYGDRWNYTEHKLYDFYEYNHTTIAKVNTTATIYNPTYAMYMAKIHLVRNYQDINRTRVVFHYIFLVPRSLLPDKYANYSYLWVISSWAGIREDSNLIQANYTDVPEKPFGFGSYLLIDLNGNVVLDITKPVYYIPPPSDNCSNPGYRFTMLTEAAVAIFAIVVLSVVIAVKLKRRKEESTNKK